jgi:hypothetical protein
MKGPSVLARWWHIGHFAFMRSVVQGLGPRESWERHFRVQGEAIGQRAMRATISTAVSGT